MNGDGLPDIVAINGDHVGGNMDGPSRHTPRRHHGIRVYENLGDLKFSEAYFYHLPGATKAALNDIDADGDLDIFVVSMFPDWTTDEPETFLYLENGGDWAFESYSLPTEFFGVWSSVSLGDVNGDQKTDVILGSGDYPELTPMDWRSRDFMADRGDIPTVLYLLNEN